MKVVILAGGYGTRISEESQLKPKPMIEIGHKPILWHIMKIYSHFGFNDFIICLGYKGYMIKEYFAHYFLNEADVTFDFSTESRHIIPGHAVEPWKVTLVNTGLKTMTGGRIKRIQPLIGNETFMLTYGDGVGNINIKSLYEFHRSHKKMATVTAVEPTARFGALNIEGNTVLSFSEKPRGDQGWVSGGFFVMEPDIFNYIPDDSILLEKEPLEQISAKGQLHAYKHTGFWYPMDKISDKVYLESLWESGNAPWKLW
jgi:glucose-1-phosphate cytidylyltransferase